MKKKFLETQFAQNNEKPFEKIHNDDALSRQFSELHEDYRDHPEKIEALLGKEYCEDRREELRKQSFSLENILAELVAEATHKFTTNQLKTAKNEEGIELLREIYRTKEKKEAKEKKEEIEKLKQQARVYSGDLTIMLHEYEDPGSLKNKDNMPIYTGLYNALKIAFHFELSQQQNTWMSEKLKTSSPLNEAEFAQFTSKKINEIKEKLYKMDVGQNGKISFEELNSDLARNSAKAKNIRPFFEIMAPYMSGRELSKGELKRRIKAYLSTVAKKTVTGEKLQRVSELYAEESDVTKKLADEIRYVMMFVIANEKMTSGEFLIILEEVKTEMQAKDDQEKQDLEADPMGLELPPSDFFKVFTTACREGKIEEFLKLDKKGQDKAIAERQKKLQQKPINRTGTSLEEHGSLGKIIAYLAHYPAELALLAAFVFALQDPSSLMNPANLVLAGVIFVSAAEFGYFNAKPSLQLPKPKELNKKLESSNTISKDVKKCVHALKKSAFAPRGDGEEYHELGKILQGAIVKKGHPYRLLPADLKKTKLFGEDDSNIPAELTNQDAQELFRLVYYYHAHQEAPAFKLDTSVAGK